jgi:hypothetical protein
LYILAIYIPRKYVVDIIIVLRIHAGREHRSVKYADSVCRLQVGPPGFAGGT